ncbi:hypothetical protein NBH00_18775 [Paraconexibacter antarcticus]|uniref:Uncharacterized protein n=1 Tax=Paraconexibacter antarcticus TaxID=2949664 RepID=A0ABY5DMY3_9ACTN|nr:hypothetical protein [Paraconexibacter antarcticus]UTI63383.1 hypothetical protein NBH00_18775 [Paraconexibacter antarcticus]
MEGGSNAQTASGYSGSGIKGVGGCETPQDRSARMSTVASLKDALALQLHRHEYKIARIQRRVIARFQKRAAQNIPLCPTADLRSVVYGFMGAQATKVTITDHGTTHVAKPSAKESGAFLVVLVGPWTRHQGYVRTAYYRDGVTCPFSADQPVAAPAACSPPPGFPKPQPRAGAPTTPPRPPAALHVPVQVNGLTLYFTPPTTDLYSVEIQCKPKSVMGEPGRTLPGGRRARWRLRGPLPRFCDAVNGRLLGRVTAAKTAQIIGTFRIRAPR